MSKKGFFTVVFFIAVVVGITFGTSDKITKTDLAKSKDNVISQPEVDLTGEEKIIVNSSDDLVKTETESVNNNSEEDNIIDTSELQSSNEIEEIGVYREYPSVLSTAFKDLKLNADNGDLESAFILGELLQMCALEPKSEAEYTEVISKNFESPIARADEGYKLCKGITREQLALSTQYLEQAAKGGDVEAMLSLFRATPLEIENYNDDYKPDSISDKKYIESLFERKIDYLNSAVKKGNIDSAIALGLAYSNDFSPTITGYDIEKGLENLMLAKLMDPNDGMNIGAFIGFLEEKTPIHTFESVQRKAEKRFKESLNEKRFTYIEKPTKNGR